MAVKLMRSRIEVIPLIASLRVSSFSYKQAALITARTKYMNYTYNEESLLALESVYSAILHNCRLKLPLRFTSFMK